MKKCLWCKKRKVMYQEANTCEPCLIKRQDRDKKRIERTSQFIATGRGDRDIASYIKK